MRVSVIICTHNPRREYLRRTLGGLEAQTLPKTDWELLLIDNRSDQPLTESVNLSWHPQSRIVREENLGLSSARARGITESRGDLLVFVDDDNVLDRDYLSHATRVADEWPQLGIWSGSSLPEFEVPPSPELQPFLYCLALREVTSPRVSDSWQRQEAEPHGAGLCIRRSAALAYRDFYLNSALQVGDRSGVSLMSGGDTEMAYYVCSLGLSMGVFPELKLTHLIPASRLTEDYIARISEGLETSSMLLFYKWGNTMPPSQYSPRELARFLKHFLLSRGLERKLALGRMRAARAVRKLIRAQPEAGEIASPLSLRQA